MKRSTALHLHNEHLESLVLVSEETLFVLRADIAELHSGCTDLVPDPMSMTTPSAHSRRCFLCLYGRTVHRPG